MCATAALATRSTTKVKGVGLIRAYAGYILKQYCVPMAGPRGERQSGGRDLTKLLNVASVPAKEGARGLVPSIHHRALDGSDSLPPGQHICACRHLPQTLHVSICAYDMALCASTWKLDLVPRSAQGWVHAAPRAYTNMHGLCMSLLCILQASTYVEEMRT